LDEAALKLHVGIRLYQQRRIVGLTQKQLGVACDVKHQSVHQWEIGGACVSAANLWVLANILGVTPDYFFQGLPGSHSVSLGPSFH